MPNPSQPGESCQIVVDDLFTMVNNRRKMMRLDPVENRAMASRCTLRFNLGQQRGVDFNNKTVSIARQDMPILRDMVNDQFGVNFEDELTNLCAKARAETVPRMVTTHAPKPEPQSEPPPGPGAIPQKSGFGSKLKRLFGSH